MAGVLWAGVLWAAVAGVLWAVRWPLWAVPLWPGWPVPGVLAGAAVGRCGNGPLESILRPSNRTAPSLAPAGARSGRVRQAGPLRIDSMVRGVGVSAVAGVLAAGRGAGRWPLAETENGPGEYPGPLWPVPLWGAASGQRCRPRVGKLRRMRELRRGLSRP